MSKEEGLTKEQNRELIKKYHQMEESGSQRIPIVVGREWPGSAERVTTSLMVAEADDFAVRQ